MKDEILMNLLGTTDWLTFLFLVFWAGMGSFTLRIVYAMTRKPLSPGTPVTFSWGYFLHDNLPKFLGEWFLAIIVIRFSENYIGEKATTYIAFGIGLVANLLPMYIGKAIKKLQEKFGVTDDTNKTG